MTLIPEYHFLLTKPPSGNGVKVSVLIDGNADTMPPGEIAPDLLDRLVQAHAEGRAPFMSFTEYPLRLEAIEMAQAGKRALIHARSLQDADGLPQDWEPAGPEALP